MSNIKKIFAIKNWIYTVLSLNHEHDLKKGKLRCMYDFMQGTVNLLQLGQSF